MTPSNYQAIVAAPVFSLGIRCTATEVLAIDFLESCPEQQGNTPLANRAAEQLRAYLSQPDCMFDLPLKSAGTPFQQRVWQQIAAIPCGETRFYGQLAQNLQNAPRAVGQACGANPYPVVIPCHRVIATGGGLGGFARERGGFLLQIKRWLLEHENRQTG